MKNKKLFNFLVVFFLMLLPLTMVAQTIKGKVTDSSGAALPYVNIVEKGNSSNGTTSDDAGEFSINVLSLPTAFTVSSMGFETKEITVSDIAYLSVTISEDN